MGLGNWLDRRTGYRKLISALLLEHVPGGARWRYVWGSCLAFVFVVQLVTGVLLMTAYSPGDSTAWSSVYYIQYEMDFGWLVRGLHHFGSQAMVVLMALHLLQVVIAGAHLSPREINWWLGLLLMMVVFGLGLTGYLLPWDQKGYWATQVATNIMGGIPFIGPWMRKVVIGGSEYGHQTLTRFYALHVGILPPLLIGLLILHVAVFRRHGVKTPKNPTKKQEDGWFWPDQAFRDLLISLVIFGILVTLVLVGHGQTVDEPNQFVNNPSTYEKWAHAGQAGLGANLDAPADRSTEGYPARPEWYYLFLFQTLKYFPGNKTIPGTDLSLQLVGTVIIPGAVFTLLFLLPLLGYGKMRKFGHGFGVLVVSALLIAVTVLTYLSIREDYGTPVFEIVNAAGNDRQVLGKGLSVCAGFFAVLFVLSFWGRGIARLGTVPRLLLTLALFGGFGAATYFATTGSALDAVFQPLTKLDGKQELIGEWIVPIAALSLPFLFLFVAYGKLRRIAGSLMLLVATGVLLGFGQVAYVGPPRSYHLSHKAEEFKKDREVASRLAKRSIQLARDGIPAEGAHFLLRRDPMTRGRELFKQNCLSCHARGDDPDLENASPSASDLFGWGGEDWNFRFLSDPGHEDFLGMVMMKDERGKVMMDEGKPMPALDTMANEIKRRFKEFVMPQEEFDAKLNQMPQAEQTAMRAKRDKQEKDLRMLARWLASHPGRASAADQRAQWYKDGRKAFSDEGNNCQRCHGMPGEPMPERLRAPDLTGYGDDEWLRTMIINPAGRLRYSGNNHMPAFVPGEGPGAAMSELLVGHVRRSLIEKMKPPEKDLVTLKKERDTLIGEFLTPLSPLFELKPLSEGMDVQAKLNGLIEKREANKLAIEERMSFEGATRVIHLSDVDRELIIRFIRNDSRVVFGGSVISGPPIPK